MAYPSYRTSLERRRQLRQKYERKRRARMRRIMAAAKTTCGCEECGYDEHPDAIEFDHVRPVGQLVDGKPRRPWSSIRSYAAFWRLFFDPNVRFLCANCHAIKSVAEQRDRVSLGLRDGRGAA